MAKRNQSSSRTGGTGPTGNGGSAVTDDGSIDSAGIEGAGGTGGDAGEPTGNLADGGIGSDGDGPRIYFSDPEADGIDAGAGAGSGGSGTGRKRGRPKGSRNTGSSRSNTKTTQDLTEILFLTHLLLASTMGLRELQIDRDEAKILSDATVRLTELYEIPLPSEKVMAWIGLGTACGKVYGPRMAAIMMRAPKTINAKPVQQVHPQPDVRSNPVPPSGNASMWEPA